MVYGEFKRSSKNRAAFKVLLDELKRRYPNYDWKLYYPILFCLTRWLGFLFCAELLSRRSTRTILNKYVEQLREQGYGPRTFDPHQYRRRRGVRDAHLAGADDRDGDLSSEEEQEIRDVQEAIAEDRLDADGYQPAPQLFATAEAAAASAPSQSDLAAAEGFDVGDDTASRYKCKNLLNANVGLTRVNAGRSAWLSGVLKPYQVLVEGLQRTDQPIQHLVARQIRRFHMVMQTSWVGTRQSEPMYACRAFHDWLDRNVEDEDLCGLVKKECRAFASVFVTSVKERLSSIWDHLQALELIDPLGPELAKFATPAVWNAMKDLCRRRRVDFEKVREQIIDIRAQAASLDADSKALIRMDLCGYFRQRHKEYVLTSTPSPTPEFDSVCQFVFSIPFTSAFVESLFSKMAYNQSKIRSRLADTTMTSILHLHDAVLPDPQKCLPNSRVLKASVPRSCQDKLLMNKMLRTRVCEVFEGQRYHGEVTEIRFHEVYAQYMYHVEYIDGDACDYWRHELEMIQCRCDESESDSTDSDSGD